MPAPRILVAPLDWGLGHATRCIPLVRAFMAEGAEVIIGGTETSRKRILQAVPGLEEVDLPAYNIRYSRTFPAWFMAGLGGPKMLKAIRQENQALQTLVPELGLSGILSDNRYGLYHQKIPSVLISHQLNLIFPKLMPGRGVMIHRLLHHQLRKFSEIWIPDIAPGDDVFSFGTLSGVLSDPLPSGLKLRFTGLLSRFQPGQTLKSQEPALYDLAVVASGPSPQKEEFLKLAMEYVQKNNLKASWLLPDELGVSFLQDQLSQVYIAAGDDEFLKIIGQSAQILSRSGYSSLSDWLILNRGAILVPTPGQTEQEYLARHLSGQHGFYSIAQNKLSDAAIIPPNSIITFDAGYENHQLRQVVEEFLRGI